MPRQSLLAKQKTTKASSPFGNTAYSYSGGRLIAYNDKQSTYIEKGYRFNDIVYSCVRLIIDKCEVSKWGIFTIEDENAYKAYQVLIRKKDWLITDYKKAVDLQKKSLKPVSNTGKWGELIEYPNEYETHSCFVANGVGYKLLTGNNYERALLLDGGANSGLPQNIHNLPAQFVSIDALDTFPAIIKNYSIAQWPNAKFDPTEILHEKFWNPEWGTSGSHLYGQAPLLAALTILLQDNSLIRAMAATYKNEGIKGILHMKAQPGAADGDELIKEVDRLKTTMKTEWTGEENRGRMGLGAYDMGWLAVGMSNEEMEMVKTRLQNLRFICNIFGGIPSQILNDPENKVYNNTKEGEKALTSRCVLPHLCYHRDAFNRKAKADWKFNKNWVYDFDMSVYSELAADAKEVAEYLKGLTVIVPNEERELVGLAALAEKKLDKPWVISGGRQPLEDFLMSQTDDQLNDDTDI